MSDLPSTWANIKILEVLSPNNNGKPIQQGWSPQCDKLPAEDDEWGVLKTTAIQEGEFLEDENKRLPYSLEPRPHLEVKQGDILMTCAGPRSRCGVTCLVKNTRKKLMMSGKMYRFRADSRMILPKFLETYLHSRDAKHTIDRMKTGISDSGLNLTHGRFLELDVPIAPLGEQHRIISMIEELFSELDKGIESLKTARAQLKVYRQALLKHAFKGKGTEQWRIENKDYLETADEVLAHIHQQREARHKLHLNNWKAAVKEWEVDGKPGKKPSKPRALKQFTRLNSEEVSDLPENWFWDKLGLMTCGVDYGTAAKSSKSGKVPVLRMGNIQNAKIDWTDLVYTSDEFEIQQYLLQYGDVLFNRTNSPEWVGKTAIYRGERPALFAGYLIRVNQIDSVVDSQYLNLFLNSHIAKQHGNMVKTDGVNQSNINGEKLQNYPFPYCSLAEQREIVCLLEEKLSVVDQMEHEIDQELQKSEVLRQSILKKAFFGQLVAQDPNDESASVLLERIKAEKLAQSKQDKNSKKGKQAA